MNAALYCQHSIVNIGIGLIIIQYWWLFSYRTPDLLRCPVPCVTQQLHTSQKYNQWPALSVATVAPGNQYSLSLISTRKYRWTNSNQTTNLTKPPICPESCLDCFYKKSFFFLLWEKPLKCLFLSAYWYVHVWKRHNFLIYLNTSKNKPLQYQTERGI